MPNLPTQTQFTRPQKIKTSSPAEPEYTFEEAAKIWGRGMTHLKLREHARRHELRVIVYGPRTKRIRYSDLMRFRIRYSDLMKLRSTV